MRRIARALGLVMLIAAPATSPASACADLQALFNPSVHVELASAVEERRFKAAERILATRSLKGLDAKMGGALIQEVLRGHGERQLTPTTVRLMKTLLETGADPDAIRPGGYTPLMLVTGALEQPALVAEAIDVLLEAGGDIDARSNFGGTPLMHAAAEGNGAAVELLLRHGADVMLKDEDGMTAADAARLWEHDALAKQLRALETQY